MKAAFRYSTLLLQGLLYLLPFLLVVWLAFQPGWRYPQLLATYSLKAWRWIGEGATPLPAALGRSFSLALLVGAGATLAGFGLSRGLYFSRWRIQARRWAFFPFLLTPVIYALLLQYYFTWLGWTGQWAGVFAGQLLITFPFAFLFFQGFWGTRTASYEGLAQTLGASSWQVLLRVLWPYARRPLVTCFVQTFLISWFEYGLTSILGLGKVATLPLVVFQYISESNVALAAAGSSLMILPPLLLLWMNKKWLLPERLYEF